MMDTCHFTFVKPTKCTTPRVNSNENYGLWVIMMYLYWFVDITSGARCGRWGWLCVPAVGVHIGATSVLCAQFFCEPKIAFRNKVY